MDDIFINDICKFNITHNKHLIKENMNVIVSSFFKRNEYYKNFNIYVKGLKKLLKYVETKKKDYTYLLFIDENINNDNNIMNMVKKCSNCVVIVFTCSKYMIDKYHIDLFGTLVRFFPMFNFKNNPCNIVICVDIDLHEQDYFRFNKLITEQYKGIVGNGSFIEFIKGSHDKPHLYAGSISYNIKKSDYNLITDFIINIKDITTPGRYNTRFTDFGYGVDEIFLNDILLPKIGSVGVIIEYYISYFLFHSYDRILSQPKKSEKILSAILGRYNTEINNTNDIKEKLNFIDANTYKIRKRTDINNTLSKRFSKVIKYLYNNKIKWMNWNIIKFIHKYLSNVISATAVMYYDYNKNKITTVKLYDKVEF